VIASAGHLLSLVDARARHDDPGNTTKALSDEEERLAHIDSYYCSAANGQAQIMYFAGMAGVAVILCGVSTFLWLVVGPRGIFAALIAGSIGAVISVLQRIDDRSFALEYDVGRKYVLFIGGLRPMLGAVFGLTIYLAFVSGLVSLGLPGHPDTNVRFYSLIVLAFIAGFNERWAQDTLAAATGSNDDRAGARSRVSPSGVPPNAEAPARPQPGG
jgi:hypothetical protein